MVTLPRGREYVCVSIRLSAKKAIYCDTDSVMFIQSRGEIQLVETGDKLGDMTSELKILVIMSEFVSGRTKNCAYTIIDSRNSQTKTVCKIRGIILNCNVSQLENFDVIKELFLNKNPPIQ